jgi:hypothetical protein
LGHSIEKKDLKTIQTGSKVQDGKEEISTKQRSNQRRVKQIACFLNSDK